MLDIVEELKNIYRNDRVPLTASPAHIVLKLYFPDLDFTLSNDKIDAETFELNESLCHGDDLVFGSCEASQLKITIADIDVDLSGQTMIVTQTVNDTYTIPVGTFIVKSCKRKDDQWFREIIAYDYMKKFDVDVSDWYNGLFPTGNETYTLAQFRALLLAYFNIEEDTSNLPLPNDNMIVEKTIEPTQISGRDVLQACEEINGSFGHMGRDGKFKHIVLQPGYGLYPSETLYPSEDLFPVDENDTSYVHESIIDETIGRPMYKEVKFEEYTVKEIDKLIIRAEEDDIGAIVGGDQRRVIDTQVGTSIQSTKSDDSVVEIQKIEGISSQVVTAQGKNLIDYTKASNNSLTALNIFADGEISASGKKAYCHFDFSLPLTLKGKTVSARYTILEDTSVSTNIRLSGKKEDNSRYYLTIPNGGKVTIPTTATTVMFEFMMNNTATDLETDTVLRVKDIQLELGSTVTPYAPFVPKSPSPDYPSPIISASDFTITASNGTDENKITIPYDLAKLPNGISDEIMHISSDKGKYIQRVGKAVLNGVENYTIDTQSLLVSPTNISTKSNTTLPNTVLANRFVSNFLSTARTSNYAICNYGTRIYLRNVNLGVDINAWKTWLSQNPITVLYELATPIETIIDLPSLTSYKGITNITTTANPQVNLTVDFYVNPINTYIIEGNFLVFGKSAVELEQIALNAFGNMAKRPYRPYEAQSIGLPYIEVGDALQFATDDVVVGYVLQRTLTGIQALRDTYTAKGNEKREQNFGLNTEIIQLQGRYNKIKKDVDGVSIEVGNLEARTNTKFEQTDEKINLEAQRAIGAEGTLSGQIEVMAGQVVLKVDSNGNLATVELDADPSEGTSIKLKADNMIFEGLVTANGNFKILADGSMEAKNGKFSGTLSGSTINGGVINGTRIVSSGNGVLEINGAEISGYNSSGGLVLWINANGTINAGTLTALDMHCTNLHCTNLACGKLNGYTPITSGNIGEQWAYGAQVAISAGKLSNTLSTNQIYASDTGYGNIDFLGFDNAAGVNWVQANFAPKTSSDVRLKYDIHTLDSIPNELFMSLKPKQFRFKTDKDGKGIYFGLIAQELENAFLLHGLNPYDYDIIELEDVRNYTDDGMYVDGETHRINYINFIPWMVKIIQEQNDKIISLEDIVQEQNERISTLEEKLYNY